MARPYRTAEYQAVDWERPAQPLAVRRPAAALRSAAPQSATRRAPTPEAAPRVADPALVTASLAKITFYSAIIVATGTSLTRLLPLYALQQERLSVLAAEVERLDQRVAQVRMAVPDELDLEQLDLSQASAAMRERVNYIPPNQLHVRLDTVEPEPVLPEAPEPSTHVLGFLWPWR